MKNTLRTEDMTIVDFGSHFYPVETDEEDRAGSQQDEYIGNDEHDAWDRIHDADTQLKEMQDAGVDAIVHSDSNHMGSRNAETCREANDHLLNHIQSYDEFYGLASVPIGAGGDIAAEEFERCLDAGFNGGALDETDVEIHEKEFEPVLEVADQTGAPVMVHIPELPHDEYRFNATYGREHAMQVSIAKTIHEGVFDRYDNLNLVWHHTGGNIAAMMGRTHLQIDAGRWPSQENLKSFEEFKWDLENRVYVDTSGFFGYTAPIRIALEEMPSTQLLFGTDLPWEPRNAYELRDCAEAIIEAGTLKDAERILGQNALDLMVNV